MADQRPFSRFRLPWLSAVSGPQPQLQPQATRPADIVAPPQLQRPPFRPAGTAQSHSQPSSPSQATTQTRAASVPTSLSRATTEANAASVSSSPSREAPEASQTHSPSHAAPQPKAASVPPSPTRTTTQPQPTSQKIPQQLSSSPPSSPPKRVTQFLPTQPSQFPPSPTQQEPKPAVHLQEAAEEVKAAELGKRDTEKLKAKELSAHAKEDKMTITNSSSGEQIKTVSSTHSKLNNKLIESHQKPGMPNGEQVPLQKEIKDDITKFVHKLATGQLKYPMDDKPVSIVTIAGENKGASLHVTSEQERKEGSVHIHRSYKLNPDERAGTTTDAEESKKRKNPTGELVKKAFMNSNTQSINNSMLLQTSVNEGSPGIHLVLSRNLAEPIKSEPLETYKAEVSVTPAQKLTYDLTLRRRCLGGLFSESSDSDPKNPEESRRHGCPYNCGERSKDKDIGIF